MPARTSTFTHTTLAALILASISGAAPLLAQTSTGEKTPVVVPTGPRRVIRSAGAPGPGGPRQPEPLLNGTNFMKYANVLKLDADQTKAAQMAHEAYVAESARAEKKMRSDIDAAMEDMRDGDPAALRNGGTFAKAMEASAAERARLKRQFLGDLKAILTPEQASNFDAFERALRRDTWAQRGTLAGSAVNLFTTVDQLKLENSLRAQLDATLGQYDADLDRVLREREAFAQEQSSGGPVRMFDLEAFRAMNEKRGAVDMKVREVNERYARLVASQLPDEQRKAFDDLLKQSMFRQVYRPSKAERKAQAAAKLAGVTPEQQAKITDAMNKYRAGLPSVNSRWADAIQRAERDGKPASGGLNGLPILGAQDKPAPELADARKARQDLDKQLDETLKNTLTSDQLDALKANSGSGAIAGRKIEMNVTSDGANAHTFTQEVELDDEDIEDAVVLGAGGGPNIMIIRDEKTMNVPGHRGEPTPDDQKKDEPKKDEPKKP
jgi:hypothetical protein